MEKDDGGGGSGRCTCCSFVFALCKIACFAVSFAYILNLHKFTLLSMQQL